MPAGVKVAAPRVFGFDPSFRNPRSLQGSATVERLVGDTVTLSVSYVHSDTRNLQRRLDRNQTEPAFRTCSSPPALRNLSATDDARDWE